MAKEREFASVSWTIRDVQELASQLTDEQAEEFLFNNQHTLRDALISHGWAVLEELLSEEGITIQPQDDEEDEEDEEESKPPFRVFICWGSDDTRACQNGRFSFLENNPCEYEFATEAELIAFMEGVDAGSGWLDYYCFDIESHPEELELARTRTNASNVEAEEPEEEPSECPYCHQSRITDEDVYVCPQCGKETCTDCAGRCGCDDNA